MLVLDVIKKSTFKNVYLNYIKYLLIRMPLAIVEQTDNGTPIGMPIGARTVHTRKLNYCQSDS